MNTHSVVSIRNLTYAYPDGTKALDSVCLEIKKGERLGIIGPNGAGKSTLLLHLNGMIAGNGGVIVCGLRAEKKNLKEIRRKVGLVFQNPEDQLFCPTLFDDVAFGPRNMKIPESVISALVEKSLEKVGLAGMSPKSAFHLSQGQKKRAAIATVLSMSPELLALDEPTSSLDPRARNQVIRLLEELGGTQIIVSHDAALLKKLCSRVALLSGGKITAESDAETMLGNLPLLEKHGMM